MLTSQFALSLAQQSELELTDAFRFSLLFFRDAESTGILGTSLHASDLTIPIVAGSFLFIGQVLLVAFRPHRDEDVADLHSFSFSFRAVTVVPELLADCKSGKQLIKEMLAMGVGICW